MKRKCSRSSDGRAAMGRSRREYGYKGAGKRRRIWRGGKGKVAGEINTRKRKIDV